jgi:hypothetical protein
MYHPQNALRLFAATVVRFQRDVTLIITPTIFFLECSAICTLQSDRAQAAWPHQAEWSKRAGTEFVQVMSNKQL